MNSPAHDIARYLCAQLTLPFGTADEWSISVNAERATPANVITVYDYGGDGPDTDELDEYLNNFQVRVRSAAQDEGYAKQELARRALLTSRNGFEAETSRFVLVAMTSDVLPIGRDANDNFLLVANYRSRRISKE
jgi:hypothetical protein